MNGSAELLDTVVLGAGLAVGCGVPIALLVAFAAQCVARRAAAARSAEREQNEGDDDR